MKLLLLGTILGVALAALAARRRTDWVRCDPDWDEPEDGYVPVDVHVANTMAQLDRCLDCQRRNAWWARA